MPTSSCTNLAGNQFLVPVKSMKFISLDSSGEMEPLEMLFPPVTVPGNTVSPDMPVIGLDSESPLPDLDEVPLSDPAAGGLPLQLPQEDASEEPSAVLRKPSF